MKHRFPVVIGENTYEIQHFMPKKAISILTRLLNILGGGVVGLDGGIDKDVLSALPKVIGELFARMDETKVNKLIDDMMSDVFLGIQPVQWEIQFQGKLEDLFELLSHVMRVQYSGFLDKLAAKFKNAAALLQARQNQNSQNISTG